MVDADARKASKMRMKSRWRVDGENKNVSLLSHRVNRCMEQLNKERIKLIAYSGVRRRD